MGGCKDGGGGVKMWEGGVKMYYYQQAKFYPLFSEHEVEIY